MNEKLKNFLKIAVVAIFLVAVGLGVSQQQENRSYLLGEIGPEPECSERPICEDGEVSFDTDSPPDGCVDSCGVCDNSQCSTPGGFECVPGVTTLTCGSSGTICVPDAEFQAKCGAPPGGCIQGAFCESADDTQSCGAGGCVLTGESYQTSCGVLSESECISSGGRVSSEPCESAGNIRCFFSGYTCDNCPVSECVPGAECLTDADCGGVSGGDVICSSPKGVICSIADCAKNYKFCGDAGCIPETQTCTAELCEQGECYIVYGGGGTVTCDSPIDCPKSMPLPPEQIFCESGELVTASYVCTTPQNCLELEGIAFGVPPNLCADLCEEVGKEACWIPASLEYPATHYFCAPEQPACTSAGGGGGTCEGGSPGGCLEATCDELECAERGGTLVGTLANPLTQISCQTQDQCRALAAQLGVQASWGISLESCGLATASCAFGQDICLLAGAHPEVGEVATDYFLPVCVSSCEPQVGSCVCEEPPPPLCSGDVTVSITVHRITSEGVFKETPKGSEAHLVTKDQVRNGCSDVSEGLLLGVDSTLYHLGGDVARCIYNLKPVVDTCTTDPNGECIISNLGTEDYVVAVRYSSVFSETFEYQAKAISDFCPAGETIDSKLRNFQFIINEKKPEHTVHSAKVSARIKGSELVILEPIEWDVGDYPIVYESLDGSWKIQTNVEVPEGYVAAPGVVTENVDYELTADVIQINDTGGTDDNILGSIFKAKKEKDDDGDMKVRHQVKNKKSGETMTVESKTRAKGKK